MTKEYTLHFYIKEGKTMTIESGDVVEVIGSEATGLVSACETINGELYCGVGLYNPSALYPYKQFYRILPARLLNKLSA